MSGLDFDVVVIGAGIAGASVAAELASSRRVLVIERESQPGYHSTGRSAALFSEIYGPEAVRALSRASRQTLFHPPADLADAPLTRRRGALYIAPEAEVETLRAFADLPDVAGATRLVSVEEAYALCPLLRPGHVVAAVYEPDAADVDVHALHQGYLRQVRQRGGELKTECEVTAIRPCAGGWILEIGGLSVSAGIVVNAAGAWADRVAALAGVLPIGLQPMRRTAVLVDPPAGMNPDAWPMVIGAEETFYFKPDAGKLLLSPADETPVEPCDVQPDEWDVAVAVDRVEQATILQVRQVRHRWAGLRSFVPDRSPVIGFEPGVNGFFWLAAQGGYGIQAGPGIAMLAAALVLGRPLPDVLVSAGVKPASVSPARLRTANRDPAVQAAG